MRKLLLALPLALMVPVGSVFPADSTAALKAQLDEAMRTIKDLQSRVVTLETQQAKAATAPSTSTAAIAAPPAASTSVPTAGGGVLVYALSGA